MLQLLQVLPLNKSTMARMPKPVFSVPSQVLVKHLLDDNHDDVVTTDELCLLELKATAFATAKSRPPPNNMRDVFKSIFRGYNWDNFLAALHNAPSVTAIATITATLQVGHASPDVPAILEHRLSRMLLHQFLSHYIMCSAILLAPMS